MSHRAISARALALAPLFAAFAVLLALPVLLHPPLVHDSFGIDYLWTGRFADALRAGDLYPRWLDGSFDGLGAPVFYFYGPLPFYVSGLLNLVGLNAYAALIGSFLLALAGSGLAMFVWLRPAPGALPGALLYMAMPYHLIDFARRGAIGEFFAAAILPLVALGVVRAAERGGSVLLAIAYAALLFSHLPTALLVSIALVGPMVLWLGWRDPTRLLPITAGLAAGLALSGLYWIPALRLQSATNMATMWGSGLTPADWSLLHPERWPSSGLMVVVSAITIAVATPALFALKQRRDLWAILTVVSAILSLGLVSAFWSLPLVSKVQFPWRMLTVTEFCFLSFLIGSPWSSATKRLVALPLLILSCPVILSPLPSGHPTLAELRLRQPEVPEYLPAGTRFRSPEDALAYAAQVPLQAAHDGVVTLRRFYFPRWRVECAGREVPAFAQPGTGLLSYRGPAGCEVRATSTTAERLGTVVSAIGFLILVLLVIAERRDGPVPAPRLRRSVPLPAT